MSKSSFIKYKILTILNMALIIPLIAQDPTVGLILNDSKSFDGYVLFGPKNATTTYLINTEGNIVNKWESAFLPASTAYLLEDGNLLRSTKLSDPDGGNGGFQVLDWDGNVMWEYTSGPQHHDIEPMPNGNVLLITNHTIEDDTTIALDAGADTSLHTGNIRSLTILEIANNNGTGEIVWQWNAWDHLIQDFDQTKPNFGTVSDHPELINLNWVPNPNSNWIHPNSIDYNEDFDQILISSRSFNEIWVIDHSPGSDGTLMYRWGNPATYDSGDADDQFLYSQHDARWIESDLPGAGNIMVFNNGVDRPDGLYSSIDEIIPPVDNSGNYTLTAGSHFGPNELTWQYTAAEPTDMYSSRFSGAHRLPNGNTFICNGVGGELIEVTSAGEIVWKYINPESSDGTLTQYGQPSKNDVFRAHKYSTDFIVSLGVDTTSKGPIELYNVAVENENDGLNTFRLEQNFPNPFNPNTTIDFTLSQNSAVSIKIFDMLGNEIRTLLNDNLEAGLNSITWDGLDSKGNPVSSGVYLYNLSTDISSQTKKMILLR